VRLLLSVLGRVVDGVRLVVRWFVVLAFAYMTLAVWAQVGGRYFFGYSIAAASESAIWAMIWMVLLGAGIAMRHNMHVAVDALAAMLPLGPARLVKLGIAAAALWFLAVVFVGSLALLRIGQMQTSPILGVRMWIVYLGLPIGAAYLALEVVLDTVRRWHDPFGRDPESDPEGLG
jgi:TRAP-type transport system small permease protein